MEISRSENDSSVLETNTIIVIDSEIYPNSITKDDDDRTMELQRKEKPVLRDQIVVITQDGKLIFTPDSRFESNKSSKNDKIPALRESQNNAECAIQDEIYIEIISERINNSTALSSGISHVYGSLLLQGSASYFHKCEKCGKECLTFDQLVYHVKHWHNYVPELKQCFECSASFIFSSQLFSHLSELHDVLNPERICEVCLIRFDSEPEKLSHQASHLLTHGCSMCFKKFATFNKLNNHIKNHDNSEDQCLKCHVCGQSFKSSFVFQMHSMRHGRATCGICQYSVGFLNQVDEDPEVILIKHVRANHDKEEISKFLNFLRKQDKEEAELDKLHSNTKSAGHPIGRKISNEEEKTRESTENKSGKDHVVGKLFLETSKEKDFSMSGSSLKKPKGTFTGLKLQDKKTKGNKQPGNNCTIERSKNTGLEHCPVDLYSKNIESLTSGKPDLPASNSCLKQPTLNRKENNIVTEDCKQCGEKLENEEAILLHSLSHQSPYKCEICEEGFSFRRKYKQHMKTHGVQHSRVKAGFNCNICSVSCPTLSGIRAHILTHANKKPFSCKECGKLFTRAHAVRLHIQSAHTALVPSYRCVQCNWNSSNRASLLRHMMCVHKGVRRFICGICGSRWLQNQDLRRHLSLAHTVEIPPMPVLSKKTCKEIHVIPSIDNLNSADPLAKRIKAAVTEELQKILKATKVTDSKEKSYSTGEENGNVIPSNFVVATQNQPLTLLGDVASQQSSICSSSNIPVNDSNTFCSLLAGKLEETSMNKTSTTSVDTVLLQNIVPVYSMPLPTIPVVILPDQTYFFPTEPISASILPYTEPSIVETAVPESIGLTIGPLQEQVPPSVLDPALISLAKSNETSGTQEISGNFFQPMPNQIQSFDMGVNASDGVNEKLIPEVNENCEQTAFELCAGQTTEPLRLQSTPNNKTLKAMDPVMLNVGSEVLSSSLSQEKDLVKILNDASNQNDLDISSVWMNFREKTCEDRDGNQKSALDEIPHECDEDSIALWGNHHNRVVTNNFKEDTLSKTITEETNLGTSFSKSTEEDEQVTEEADTVLLDEGGGSYENSFSAQYEKGRNLDSNGTFGVLKETKMNNVTLLKQNRNQIYKEKNIREQRNVPLFICQECGKQLSNAHTLQRHLNMHKGSKPFECAQCGKKFAEKCNLLVHTRIHSGQRPYICTVCGAMHRYLGQFKEHQLTHEGVRSFQCSECGHTFVRSRELARHTKTHSTERPECLLCNKKFSRISYLRMHMKNVHKTENDETNQIFRCLECGKELSQKDLFVAHQQEHLAQKKYHCEYCKKIFIGETTLKNHLKKFHIASKRSVNFSQARSLRNFPTLQEQKESSQPFVASSTQETERTQIVSGNSICPTPFCANSGSLMDVAKMITVPNGNLINAAFEAAINEEPDVENNMDFVGVLMEDESTSLLNSQLSETSNALCFEVINNTQ